MAWIIKFHDEFVEEFAEMSEAVQEELLAKVKMLENHGPQFGRPNVDTLNGSDFKNMKELRFKADDGVWRAAFAFDQKREAIVLVAGDKSGVSQDKFYRSLIKKADRRFREHIKGD
ncbi:MAG: type II toxin-antitoxin system RelE/ParE family toxin [Kordiimonadaceae bacterium]|nr:type II toxin-antitoxin system RelE/ParE family toxin [Kordiimonadaceae bacterium]